jgi:hypothetical protein
VISSSHRFFFPLSCFSFHSLLICVPFSLHIFLFFFDKKKIVRPSFVDIFYFFFLRSSTSICIKYVIVFCILSCES